MAYENDQDIVARVRAAYRAGIPIQAIGSRLRERNIDPEKYLPYADDEEVKKRVYAAQAAGISGDQIIQKLASMGLDPRAYGVQPVTATGGGIPPSPISPFPGQPAQHTPAGTAAPAAPAPFVVPPEIQAAAEANPVSPFMAPGKVATPVVNFRPSPAQPEIRAPNPVEERQYFPNRVDSSTAELLSRNLPSYSHPLSATQVRPFESFDRSASNVPEKPGVSDYVRAVPLAGEPAAATLEKAQRVLDAKFQDSQANEDLLMDLVSYPVLGRVVGPASDAIVNAGRGLLRFIGMKVARAVGKESWAKAAGGTLESHIVRTDLEEAANRGLISDAERRFYIKNLPREEIRRKYVVGEAPISEPESVASKPTEPPAPTPGTAKPPEAVTPSPQNVDPLSKTHDFMGVEIHPDGTRVNIYRLKESPVREKPIYSVPPHEESPEGVKLRHDVQVRIIQKAGIPKEDLGKYLQNTNVDGQHLRTYTDRTLLHPDNPSYLTENQAAELTRADYEKLKSMEGEAATKEEADKYMSEDQARQIVENAGGIFRGIQHGGAKPMVSYYYLKDGKPLDVATPIDELTPEGVTARVRGETQTPKADAWAAHRKFMNHPQLNELVDLISQVSGSEVSGIYEKYERLYHEFPAIQYAFDDEIDANKATENIPAAVEALRKLAAELKPKPEVPKPPETPVPAAEPTPSPTLAQETTPLPGQTEPVPEQTATPADKTVPGKVTILPRKRQLLLEVQEAIKKAPDVEIGSISDTGGEHPTSKEKNAILQRIAAIKNYIEQAPDASELKAEFEYELIELNKALPTAPEIPTIAFKMDGGAKIYNTKKALTEFYNRLKKAAVSETIQDKGPNYQNLHPVAAGKEFINPLRPVEKGAGFHTDGIMIVSGEPDAKAKYFNDLDPHEGGITREHLDQFINLPAKPAKFHSYIMTQKEQRATSDRPINPVKDFGNLPLAVFESEGKYYTFDQRRFRYIANRFPDAKYSISSDPKFDNLLIAEVNGKRVAVLRTSNSSQHKYSKPPDPDELAGIKKPPKPPSGDAFAAPPGEQAPTSSETSHLQTAPMPELVEMVRSLLGTVPAVHRRLGNALGMFRHIPGRAAEIILRSDVFKDIQLTSQVIAHEIGHLIDWLPNKTMARGNILGRIATLQDYLEGLLEAYPNAPGKILSSEDRTRLEREAARQIREEVKQTPEEIIEEVVKEIPIYESTGLTVDDIKEVFTGMMSREKNPALYEFIARLPTSVKKEIIRRAMQGIVDERVAQFGGKKQIGVKRVTERIVKRPMPVEASAENIRARFEKLLREEIIKRQLYEKEVITKELKDLTKWWTPFDENKSPSYTKYRYRSRELYAEALSVMLNQPEALAQRAPTFMRAFRAYIDRKPEVAAALENLQQALQLPPEKLGELREKRLLADYAKGEEARAKAQNPETPYDKSLAFHLINELENENLALHRLTGGGDKSPTLLQDEYRYIGGIEKNYVEDVAYKTIKPIIDSGMTREDIGEYLQMMNILHAMDIREEGGFYFEEPKDVARPRAFDRQTAQEHLDYLKGKLGPEKWAKLEQGAAEFYRLNREIMEEGGRSGFFTPRQMAIIRANDCYATTQVIEHISRYVSPLIHGMVGTFKESENPLNSTMLKTLSVIRAIEKNKVSRAVAESLRGDPVNYRPAETAWTGKYQKHIPPTDGSGMIMWRQNGKMRAIYTDPYIANSNARLPSRLTRGILSIFKWSNTTWFRPVFTMLSVGFQAFNVARDFMQSAKANPHTDIIPSAIETMVNYLRALPHAYRGVRGHPDDLMHYLRSIKAIDDSNMGRLQHEQGRVLEMLFNKYGIRDFHPIAPVRAIWSKIAGAPGNVLQLFETMGTLLEVIPKIAAHYTLKGTGVSTRRMVYMIHNYYGSPDFRKRGTVYDVTNNILLFSNAIMRGYVSSYELAAKKPEPGEPRSRAGFAWKTIECAVLPAAITAAAAAGHFGKELKKYYDRMTEYDKTNYIPVPLAIDRLGQCTYLRLPMDEFDRLVHAMAWKIFSQIYSPKKQQKHGVINSLGEVASIWSGQVPSMSPLIEVGMSAPQYFSSHNPTDYFKGRGVLNPNEEAILRARGPFAPQPLQTYSRWALEKMGIPTGYGLSRIHNQARETQFQKTTKHIPVVNRFLRTTSYGLTEQMQDYKNQLKANRAAMRIESRNR